jgi:SAM-dependent methyltransferase
MTSIGLLPGITQAYPFQSFATDIHLPRVVPESRRERTRYFQPDCATIPLADNSVDVVICHNTLEHFPEYRSTLRELGRVLRSSGWLWIAVPDGHGLNKDCVGRSSCDSRTRGPTHATRKSLEAPVGLQNMLPSNGVRPMSNLTPYFPFG